MKYKINQGNGYSFASITKKKSDIVTAYVSIDIHDKQTIVNQAEQLLYPDLLISGAGTYSREAFLNAVNLLGASIETSVSGGIVTVQMKSTTETFPKLCKLFSTMLTKPTFEKSEIKRVQSLVLNQLHEARENSKAISHNELANNLYKKGDRRFVYGFEETEATIKKITASNLKALHKLVLNTSWTCTIGGDESTVAMFEKQISTLKKKTTRSKSLQNFHQQNAPKKSVVLKDIPSRQNIDFSIGAPVPITLHHPDYIPLFFGLSVLGKWGGFTGRLMSTVRELEGLTYGIYAKTESFTASEQGYWRIMTFFAPEKALRGLTSTFREITKIYKSGITEAELQKFKTILGTGQALQKDSVSTMLQDLHSYHQQGFSLEEMEEHKAKIKDVTITEVNSAIKKYLNPKLITVSGAGPVKEVKKQLQDFIKTV